MLESIEKLRKWTELNHTVFHGIEVETFNGRLAPYEMAELDDIADEIEREIAERYMLLPVDADGAPIRVGDVLECDANGYKGTFTVFAIGDNTVIGNHEIEWIRDNPSKWFHVASFCRHVKPRTIEDVLTDFAEEVKGCCDTSETVGKYADEIYDLLGGDAE